jgi:hypothetical protein
MTRKSKREIERQLADLDAGTTPARDGTSIEDRCVDAVVSVVYELCRDLGRLGRQAADGTPMEEPAYTRRFVAAVREEYALDVDRDETAVQELLEVADESVHGWDSVDVFATAPVGLAGRVDVTSEGGADLQELVVDGREEAAKQLLVETVYECFAGDTGRGVEVTA